MRYRVGPGDTITILHADGVDLTGLTVVATAELGQDPDIGALGTFTDTYSHDAIEINRDDRTCYRYFLPAYSVDERRAEFSRRGYARAAAHDLASWGARDDAYLARDLEHRVVRVKVCKAGVLLGSAMTDISLAPGARLDGEIVDAVDVHRLVTSAVTQARAALLPLIAALAS